MLIDDDFDDINLDYDDGFDDFEDQTISGLQ